ncbi:MAG: SgcJ/EcaC family oxidoreductase [Pseudomonadota bacterium]
MKSSFAVALCLCSSIFASAAQAGENRAIIDAQALWEATLNGTDADAIAAHFTPDARLLPQNSGVIEGQDAIVAYWSDLIERPSQIELRLVDVDFIGDTAIQTGTYVLTLTHPDGRETVSSGKTLVVWKNDDGTWRRAQDMWNEGI